MKNVSTIPMYLNTLNLFSIQISGYVRALVDDQTSLSKFMKLLSHN